MKKKLGQCELPCVVSLQVKCIEHDVNEANARADAVSFCSRIYHQSS